MKKLLILLVFLALVKPEETKAQEKVLWAAGGFLLGNNLGYNNAVRDIYYPNTRWNGYYQDPYITQRSYSPYWNDNWRWQQRQWVDPVIYTETQVPRIVYTQQPTVVYIQRRSFCGCGSAYY